MSRWYRAYAGTIKDDKLAEVSVIAGCSRSVAIAVWHAILESAAETDDGGRFETTPRRVAAALCEPLLAIQSVFEAMTEIAMIGSDTVTAWKNRQYESDKSTGRSRKHRETLRNADATLHDRCATPPEAETDTDTETKEDATSAASSANAPVFDWNDIERQCCEAAASDRLGSFDPIRELIESRKADLELVVLPALRSRRGKSVASWRYYVPILAEAILKAAPSSPSQCPPKVFVRRDDPSWAALCALSGHPVTQFTQQRGSSADGWRFDAKIVEAYAERERNAA